MASTTLEMIAELEANKYINDLLTGRADFSDSGDTVDIDGDGLELLRGQFISLNSGDDVFTGTIFDSTGWDNQVNGNRGDDNITGNSGRDMLRGGKDADEIDGGFSGDDWMRGDNGDDLLQGSTQGLNVIRGGRDDDTIIGGNERDLLVGDTGQDVLTGKLGCDLFVLRTEATSDGVPNLATNVNEADRITDFDLTEDYLVLPKVSSLSKIGIPFENGVLYVTVTDDDDNIFIAGALEGLGVLAGVIDRVVVGDQADKVAAAMNVDFHLANPHMDSFGI